MLFAQNDASKGPICNPIQELISAPPLLKQANKETEKKKKKKRPPTTKTKPPPSHVASTDPRNCLFSLIYLLITTFSIHSEISLVKVTNNFHFAKSWSWKLTFYSKSQQYQTELTILSLKHFLVLASVDTHFFCFVLLPKRTFLFSVVDK